MDINPNKVHDAEIDERGNFKETFCVANLLRWAYVVCAIVLLMWMMGYFD